MSVDEPLSLNEVQALAPNALIMKYSGLRRFSRLPRLPLILLYETKPNYGHWVCVLRTPEGIEHFDSHGIVPDDELKWVPDWLKPSTGQDTKKLMTLLYREAAEHGTQINYNAHHLQSKDVSTCGRWCALRIALGWLPNNHFYRACVNTARAFGITPDEMVVVASA
jgi:hypothetical protein